MNSLRFGAVVMLIAVLAWLNGAGPARAADPYVPGLGDFMTAAVQPHHIKVWLAGSARNWPLAEYEAKELRETFEDITTYQGVWNDIPVGKMVESTVMPALAKLEAAIKAKNPDDFTKAYAAVTANCNSCHQAANMGFNVIKTPSATDFPDQDFQPH